jgi:short subunit dehydrogenase
MRRFRSQPPRAGSDGLPRWNCPGGVTTSSPRPATSKPSATSLPARGCGWTSPTSPPSTPRSPQQARSTCWSRTPARHCAPRWNRCRCTRWNACSSSTPSALRVTQAVLPVMRSRGSGQIVYVSSVLGRIVLPLLSAYAASKWALEAIAERWRSRSDHSGSRSASCSPAGSPPTAPSEHRSTRRRRPLPSSARPASSNAQRTRNARRGRSSHRQYR